MSVNVKVVWSAQYRGRRVPAEEVAKVVRAIEQRKGFCHPRDLWEAARPDESPIHNLFTWDVQEAAEAHWTWQARKAISCLRIEKLAEPDKTPMYVHTRLADDGTDPGGYMGLERALADPDTYRRVLEDAQRQMRGLLDRYKALKELNPVRDALDQLKLGRETDQQRRAA